MTDAAPILRCRGLGKRFAGVHALRRVDIDIYAGEIVAIVGANGAGKSTLMKILAGVLTPDSGEILLSGQPIRFAGVRDATRAGIALVHQELNLADNLDIAGNIFLGCEPNRFGFLDRKTMHTQAREWIERVGLDLSPASDVSELSIGRRQMVEIAKALSLRAKVLILDEPTSSLSMSETRRLLTLIRTLATQGVAVVYITHRLNEVLDCADRAVVLRDGARVADFSRDQLTREGLVQAMVGAVQEIRRAEVRSANEKSEARLVVRGLQTQAYPKSTVTLSIGRGEIVGLAGIVGAGRTEVLQSIFGIDRRTVGDVSLDGQAVAPNDPVSAAHRGIAMVPEDRQRDGLMLLDSVRINASVVKIARESIAGFIRRGAERMGVARMIDLMKIQPALPERQVALFSGGNQQKVVLAKWLSTEPKVLLLDEPSRGVDVAARAEIHALIRQAANRGAAVLCSISDTEELLLLCDRIVVMRKGRIEGEMNAVDATEEAITRLAVVGVEVSARSTEAAA